MVRRSFVVTRLSRLISWRPVLTILPEVCYILLYGEKPTQEEYDEFKTTVTRHTMIHQQIARLFHGFRRRDSHQMAVMCGVTGALAAFYPRLAGCE